MSRDIVGRNLSKQYYLCMPSLALYRIGTAFCITTGGRKPKERNVNSQGKGEKQAGDLCQIIRTTK